MHNLFFQLRDHFNQTFVIVTHDEHLAEITDRTIEMRDGMLYGERTSENKEEDNKEEEIKEETREVEIKEEENKEEKSNGED